MLQSSATFRYLLALVIAVWMPVCLCQQGESEPTPDHTIEPARHHDHDHDQDSDDDDDHHDGCPGHDHKGTGCDCSQQTAVLDKAESTLKHSVVVATLISLSSWDHLVVPVGDVVGSSRPMAAVPRPPTTLLRLHCALNV